MACKRIRKRKKAFCEQMPAYIVRFVFNDLLLLLPERVLSLSYDLTESMIGLGLVTLSRETAEAAFRLCAELAPDGVAAAAAEAEAADWRGSVMGVSG